MKHTFSILILICIQFGAKAQLIENAYEWAAEVIESMAMESEDADYSYIIEDLVKLYQNPINVNTSEREELEKIPFLTDIQIEAFLFHRYTNGIFNSIYELQTVEGFNRTLIEQLQPLIYFGEVQTAPRKHYIRGDLFLRTRFTLETPKGYIGNSENPAPYQGNKLLYYSRFEINPLRNLDIGFVTENDPGEPMFSNDIKTFDFLSGYVSWKPDKFVKQIIVGQYKISAGQGLVLQTGMFAGKSSNASSIRNRYGGFRTSLSTNEYSGMSGVLLSLGSKRFTVTPFLSVQKRDGRLAEDADGNIYLSGLRTDGYHRTAREIETRHNTREDVLGVQLKYSFKRLVVEAGHVEYRLQYPLIPDMQPYNHYYFRGKQNGNSWLALEGGIRNIHLFSEIAFNKSIDPALWLGLLTSPANRFNWALSYRRIPLGFDAPLSAPLAESSQGAGESGFYSGIDIELPLQLTLSTYIDYFKFKWLRYQLNAPSDGYDAMANLKYKPNRIWETNVRFRHKEKGVNLPTETPEYPTGIRKQTQLRIQTRVSPSAAWRFTTHLDFNKVDIEGRTIPNGVYVSQEVRYQNPNNKWNAVLRYGMIDAEDYESRFYIYEPDVLYSFNVPMYYGKGSRIITMVKYTVLPKFDIWLRYSQWHYYNRSTISSGNNEINSNISNEFRIQLRKRF